jgi:IclR family acetate operon transcriptional repressor
MSYGYRDARCPQRTPQATSTPKKTRCAFSQTRLSALVRALEKGGPVAGNSAEPGRSVTSKIVAILLTFHDGSEHSLTEIARLTCLPVSTAHRLVTELAGWGVLERTDESTFRIGLPIKAIGGRRSYQPAILESARRVLEDLVSAARTGAQLGILTGTDVAYIEKRCDHSPVTTFAQTARLPAHATALGKALLAFSPAEVLDRVIVNGLQGYTPNTVTDPDRLRQCLTSIRLTRVAIARWELEPGVSAVAVPVFGSGGMAVAALGLTVPNLRADLHMASSVLTIAGRGLSRELATGSHAGCFALGTEQHAPYRKEFAGSVSRP